MHWIWNTGKTLLTNPGLTMKNSLIMLEFKEKKQCLNYTGLDNMCQIVITLHAPPSHNMLFICHTTLPPPPPFFYKKWRKSKPSYYIFLQISDFTSRFFSFFICSKLTSNVCVHFKIETQKWSVNQVVNHTVNDHI